MNLHSLLLQSAIQIISPVHQSIKSCIYFCDPLLVQDITDHCLCLGDDLLQIIDFLRYNIQLVGDPFKRFLNFVPQKAVALNVYYKI